MIEAKSREGWTPTVPIQPGFQRRFGLTVTKQLGGAVERNRIRRRLKPALALTSGTHARLGFDYVVIARAPAGTKVFAELVEDFVAWASNACITVLLGRKASEGGRRTKENRPFAVTCCHWRYRTKIGT